MTALLPERAYRWNFLVMGLDMGLFMLALSFASAYGVLPLFVHHLTPSNVALGAVPAVRAVGMLLPPIFVAGLIERMRRRKPFVLGCTVFERLPYLVLAVATPYLAMTHQTLLLWLFFAMIGIGTLAGGIASPAWLDLIARVLPGDWRGRFFGLSSALGTLLGLAGGAAAAELLHRFSWPTGFALCFGCAFGCLIVSFVSLALTREHVPVPDASGAETPRHSASWHRYADVLRHDRNFDAYLIANGLVTLAGMGTAFYTVDAQRSLHLSDAAAGLYAIVLLAASTVGNVLWGHLGDHAGHKRVLEVGALCTGLAAGMALASRLPPGGVIVYGLAFALIGLGSSAIQMAALTFVLDFAGTKDRPTYIGLASLAQAPFACAAPLLGGLLADRAGYGAVFLLTLLVGVVGAVVVLLRVDDPRRTAMNERRSEARGVTGSAPTAARRGRAQ